MICAKALLIGFILPLTPIDVGVIKRAEYVCRRDYNSCVKKIYKQGPMAYHVVCFNKKMVYM